MCQFNGVIITFPIIFRIKFELDSFCSKTSILLIYKIIILSFDSY